MPLSDDELRSALAGQQWTAQNIRLSSGVSTIAGRPDFFAGNAILTAIRRTLDLIFPGGLNDVRIADLGCLEGGYALAFARDGAETLGLDVRAENIAKCELLRRHFALPNLTYVQDDVKNFNAASYGTFDAVLALGILYHLDHPVEWIEQIAGATRRVLIVETHYAPDRDDVISQLRPAIRGLGPLERFRVGEDSFEGRWLTEFATESERDAMQWASYSNARSLWLTRRSILAALQRAGFDLLYEQYDHWLAKYEVVNGEYPRTMFVAVRSGITPAA